MMIKRTAAGIGTEADSAPRVPPPSVAARPRLLVGMVSRDIVVLAKLVRTLRPMRLALFGTAFARESGWTAAAIAMLEMLTRDRPEILVSFEVIDLPNADLPAKLEWFREKLGERVSKVQDGGGLVAFDCTTGQSIFHVLGFDAIRRGGAEQGGGRLGCVH